MAEAIDGEININWLPDTFPFNQKNAPRNRAGVYIIQKNSKPIYVGKGASLTKIDRYSGVGGRAYQHYYNSFVRFDLPEELLALYSVRIGTVDDSTIAERAEKVIVRTFIRSEQDSSFPNTLTNNGNTETSPIPITHGNKVTLKLDGSPPFYLIHRLDDLARKIPLVTRINRTTYEIETTEDQPKYESFADSLTLHELRELEWV